MRILVIEDEPRVAQALQIGLASERYEVAVALTGEQGLQLLYGSSFDLVVLDLMLPACDGLHVLADLRHRGLTLPVLILTARDAVEDRVLGLDSGADDYIVKPFALPEVYARIRALLRRGPSAPATTLSCGDLVLDLAARQVRRNGEPVAVTAREFELLTYLLQHQGHVVTREMLARDVWQQPRRATPIDNVIDVQVARLRRKIDGPFAVRLLHTVRGVGFSIRAGEACSE